MTEARMDGQEIVENVLGPVYDVPHLKLVAAIDAALAQARAEEREATFERGEQ